MRSQMLYTNGSFEICQVRMFAKQRRTHGWNSYLPGKIYLSQSKNRQISTSLCLKSVKTFLSMYLCTLQ